LRAIAVVFCLAGIGLQAQSQPNQAPAAGARAAGRIIVIGCVTRETTGAAARGRGAATTARLILTDTRTDPPTAYRLEGDQAALALHVGHTVEIDGALSSTPGAGRGAAAARGLKVGSLTWISTNCQTLGSKD